MFNMCSGLYTGGIRGGSDEPPFLVLVPGKQPQDQSTTGIVRLLNATRILSGYKKMVRTKIEGHLCEQMSLFTPAPQEDGLMMADSVVDLSDVSCVVLVQNLGTMKKGCILGEVNPITEYSSSGGKDEGV